MHIGIFGGSFDPVHLGHLELARCCGEQAVLDEIWFTPVARNPLKASGPHTSDEHRLAMLRLAIADRPEWKNCSLEIDRGGISYTIETLRAIHAERPDDELFFLMGADAVRDVPQWVEPREIFRLATALVVRRAGDPEPDLAAIESLNPRGTPPQLVGMPAMDISSRAIRARVAAGEPIDEFVPPAVAQYIAEHGLYQ